MQTESTPEAKRLGLKTNTVESPKVVLQALGTPQPTAPASNPIQLPPSRSSQFLVDSSALTQQNFMEAAENGGTDPSTRTCPCNTIRA